MLLVSSFGGNDNVGQTLDMMNPSRRYVQSALKLKCFHGVTLDNGVDSLTEKINYHEILVHTENKPGHYGIV